MTIYVNVKAVGRRRPVLEARPLEITGPVETAEQLIAAVVRSEVARYNSLDEGQNLLPFLTEAEIDDRAQGGKVGFGRRYTAKKADPQKAVDTALEAFGDGIFKVLAGRTELHCPDTPVALNDGDTLTFIRLTMLSGRMW